MRQMGQEVRALLRGCRSCSFTVFIPAFHMLGTQWSRPGSRLLPQTPWAESEETDAAQRETDIQAEGGHTVPTCPPAGAKVR